MFKIISFFITILNTFNKFIWKIILFLTKLLPVDDINNGKKGPDDIRYRRFKVDEPAVIEPFVQLEKLDCKQLIQDNNIKPIKRRNGKTVDAKVSCPRCSATHEYIYDNTGKGNQFECKVCSHIFSINPNPLKDVILKCPHCRYQLSLSHEREDFNVYKCPNYNCSYYINNLNNMNKEDKIKFKANPSLFKLHYIYRSFNIEMPELKKDYLNYIRSPIDISKAYSSQYIVGLCLTYHVNYGLSYRATAAILYDIHEVKVSHQTVRNYCDAIASIVHPVLELYPYNLSSCIAGDETYTKINGKQTYTFFMFDAIKKIITSYRAYEKRDSLAAIQTIYSTLSKYSTLPDDLKFITDGNPIYNVALQYLSQHGFKFDLFQVIGLTNVDDISKEYRSEKQIIERLNRTFKFFYKPTNGTTSIFNANTYNILFATCFNFLRPHSSLKYRVPQNVERLQNKPNMPAKWLELIKMGYEYAAKTA